MNKYFFDTEFDDRGETVHLISIGICCEDGRKLHLVSNEFDEPSCNDWVKANVLPKLPPVNGLVSAANGGGRIWRSREAIKEALTAFIVKPADENADPVEIWAYFGAYDWFLFCAVMGGFREMPRHIPKCFNELRTYGTACGYTGKFKGLVPDTTNPHDALEDAIWGRDIHLALTRYRDKRQAEQLERLTAKWMDYLQEHAQGQMTSSAYALIANDFAKLLAGEQLP